MGKTLRAVQFTTQLIATFRRQLLRWFQRNKRYLPWRIEPRDPYRVWLAEVMLQQTQVSTVIPYFERWLRRFPTLESVAMASQDQVLKQWQGLGYYTRARNLHKAMQSIWNDCGGIVPSGVRELMDLPGIGRYTAGAISSLAYNKPAPIVDGNVSRVLLRVFAIASDNKLPSTQRRLWSISADLLPYRRAGQFNEALMDLGALICTPRRAHCSICPVSSLCIAYAKGKPLDYPRIAKPKIKPARHFVTLVLYSHGRQFLVAQRPRHGLLGGLWEFPSWELTTEQSSEPEVLTSTLTQASRSQLGIPLRTKLLRFVSTQKHELTHFKMIRHVALYLSRTKHLPKTRPDPYIGYKWATAADTDDLSMTRSDLRIMKHILPMIEGDHSHLD